MPKSKSTFLSFAALIANERSLCINNDANPGLKPCEDCDEPVADRSMKPGGRGPPKLKGPYEYRYKNDGHVYKMPESERAGEVCSSKNTHLKHGFKGNDIRTASLGKNPYE